MAYNLHYSDYATGSGPPDPARWVGPQGPPGPVGPPGPTGPHGINSPPLAVITSATAPSPIPDGTLWWDSAGGQLYVSYNDGNSTQWVIASSVGSGQWLPLSGGTVARHMTGTAYDSNLTVNATAVGSGVNGPTTAQIGMSINLAKDNWASGGAIGEIDGLVIQARQGGTLSDCGGMLINVAGTGNGFLAIDESVVQQQAVGTGAVLYSIRTQEGGLAPSTSSWIGKLLIADKGNLTTAIRVVNTTGQGYWGHAFENVKDGALNLYIDDSGNLNTPGTITSGGTHGTAYLRSDTSVALLYNGANNAIQFNIGGNAGEVSGGGTFSLFGQQVLRYRVTGWTAATGTATRSTFVTGSVTLPALAEHVKALIDDLMTHGMIGT